MSRLLDNLLSGIVQWQYIFWKGGALVKRFYEALLILAVLLLCGCSGTAPAQRELYAMDTVMSFKVWGRDGEAALDALTKEINSLEAQLSVTRENSLIFGLNETGSAEVSADLVDLFREAADLSRRTDGALDITIYPLVRLWGFTTGAYRVPARKEIQAAIEQCGMDYLTIDGNRLSLAPGAMVDLGAVAKGYAGREAAELLAGMDVDCAILALGGNIQTYGTKPDGSDWQIAVRDPFDESGTIGLLSLSSTVAAVTSGDYQRYFTENGKTYCHIIDPATGCPAESGLASVTVVAGDGLVADGLSTALYVMGLEKAAEFWRENRDFEAVFVTDSGEVFVTAGLESRFSCEKAQVIEE